MAHFAEIEDGIVQRVIVVANSKISDLPNPEPTDGDAEQVGAAFCVKVTGGGTWIMTSYHGNFRGRFAGIGYTYDAEKDMFIAPQPFDSWTLDEHGDWQPPVPYPDDGELYEWSEQDQEWIRDV